MKKILETIGKISSTAAVLAGFLLALGKALQVFDVEFSNSQKGRSNETDTN